MTVRSGRREPGGAGDAGDAGSGSVLIIGVVAVVVVLCAALGVLLRAESARQGAQTAADLAALAAASSVALPPGLILQEPGGPTRTGSTTACDLAGQVATRNGAVLTSCRLLGRGVVEVTTSRSAGIGDARAGARAGPRLAHVVTST
jgi:hypothetical protein